MGTQSQVSSAGTDGKLMFASDTSQFFHAGSAGTVLLGGSKVISVSTTAGFGYPQRAQWVEDFGVAVLNSSGSVTVTFPNGGFGGLPFVTLSQYTTGPSDTQVVASIFNLGINSFMIYNNLGSSGSGAAIFWRSLGTRPL